MEDVVDLLLSRGCDVNREVFESDSDTDSNGDRITAMTIAASLMNLYDFV